jgi:hypothetical protein
LSPFSRRACRRPPRGPVGPTKNKDRLHLSRWFQ